MPAIAPILSRQLLPLRFCSYSSILRQNLLSILGVIRKYSVIQKLMRSRLRNNGRQPPYGSKRSARSALFVRTFAYSTSFRHHQLQQTQLNRARTIRPRCLQQYSIFPFPIRNQSILRKWGSRNIPTQSLQSLSIFCRNLNTTMKTIPTNTGTSFGKLKFPTRKLLHTPNLHPSSRTRCRFSRNTRLLKQRQCITCLHIPIFVGLIPLL